jgi:hypothetical protein
VKLSVWLVPALGDAPRLAQLIERFAEELGAPVFPPHITLCSEPEETGLPFDPAPKLPVSVAFDSVGFGSDYFHACYLRVQNEAAVLGLSARCAAALRGRVPERYPPHLSLTYGVLTEPQRAKAAGLLPSFPVRAELDRIEIWETGGAVSQWRRVGDQR